MATPGHSTTPSGARWLRVYWSAVGLVLLLTAVFAASVLHWGAAIEAADTRYSGAAAKDCTPARAGLAGRHARRSPQGLPYRVITPRNYDARQSHGLLLVLAPAGFGSGLSERHAGLTQAATRQGFIVAYAVSVMPLSPMAVDQLVRLPAEIATKWCIDPSRVYAAGHSDGGMVALALATLPQHRGRLGAAVVSGAGWRASDFADLRCPPPLPMLILQGAEDGRFPGYGAQIAAWRSSCNICQGSAATDTNGCRRYTGCAEETVYCETVHRSHWRWAGAPEQVIDFLAVQGRDSLRQALD